MTDPSIAAPYRPRLASTLLTFVGGPWDDDPLHHHTTRADAIIDGPAGERYRHRMFVFGPVVVLAWVPSPSDEPLDELARKVARRADVTLDDRGVALRRGEGDDEPVDAPPGA